MKRARKEMTMKNIMHIMLACAVVVGIGVLLSGCATTQPTKAAAAKPSGTQETIKEPTVGLVTESVEETSAGEERSISWSGYTPKVMDKMHVTEVAFPTGNKKTSAILLHQVMPVEVLRGAEYTYEYHVTNLTDLTHQDVMITNEGTKNLEIISSSPPVMKSEDGLLSWVIGDLDPRETKVIRVKATSAVVGTALDIVSVNYENSLTAQTKVVDPDLLIVKTAATDGTICDDFWFTYEVSNPGSGMANNIRIRDEIPRGLRTVEGNKAVVEISAGDLAPGERREFTVKAKGVETGRHLSIAVATADGGLISESENIETLIYQPVLTVDAASPASQFLGRNVDKTYTVKNIGDVTAENTVVTVNIPSGEANVLQAAPNGNVSGGKVTFQLGSLGVNESKTVVVKLKAEAVGVIRSDATATAECAADVNDVTTTAVLGIPAILLELIDSGDPAEIGDMITYTITATNQGSAPDTNISIVAIIPGGQELIGTDGPTEGRLVRGRTLTFATLASIGVGAKAQWQIKVRAAKRSDVRFEVSMTSDNLRASGAVRETEATTMY